MPKRRPGWLLRGPLLAASSSLALVALAPGSGEAALRQIVLSGTVDFVGCPEPISCASFPSMWAVSGGEPASARLVYDDQSPLAFLDDQSPEYVAARYDHALPLAAPLAVEVGFGPYSAFAGAGGAAVERHAIHLFDDLGSTCCPDLSELASVETTIPAAALALPAPPGFHELELRGVRLDFLNYAGGEDLLDGAPLPPRTRRRGLVPRHDRTVRPERQSVRDLRTRRHPGDLGRVVQHRAEQAAGRARRRAADGDGAA